MALGYMSTPNLQLPTKAALISSGGWVRVLQHHRLLMYERLRMYGMESPMVPLRKEFAFWSLKSGVWSGLSFGVFVAFPHTRRNPRYGT